MLSETEKPLGLLLLDAASSIAQFDSPEEEACSHFNLKTITLRIDQVRSVLGLYRNLI